MYHDTYRSNKDQKAMEMILSVLCMVMCNRVPKGVVVFRSETIANKIRMLNVPRGVEVRDRMGIEKVTTPENPKGEEKEVKVLKNTNEKALVRILIPKTQQTQSEYEAANATNTVDAEDETNAAQQNNDYNDGEQAKQNPNDVSNPGSRRSHLSNAKSTKTIE